MNSSLDIDIRDKLASYLIGNISLSDFEDWFVSSSWNVMQRENKNTIDLVYDIELILAEHSRGCWNDEEIKQLFRPLVNSYNVNLDYIPNVEMAFNVRIELYSLSL